MSQFDDEDVPPLSPELAKFFKENDEVGSPTPGELRRGRERVLDAVSEEKQKVIPLRRRWLPPEVLAVAAVVSLIVAGQLVYVAVRRTAVEPPANDLKPLQAAWQHGSREEINSALTACKSSECRDLGRNMLGALNMSVGINSLDGPAVDNLAAIDAQLSSGGPSPIAERIAKRREALSRPPPPLPEVTKTSSAQEYFDAANALKRSKDFDKAAVRAEACTSMFPDFPPCWRLLGSVYASIAARDQSLAHQKRAKKAYETYLSVAEVGDEYVPRVRAILGLEDREPLDAAPVLSATRMAMTLGDSLTLKPLKPFTRVAVSDPNIVDVAPTGGNSLRVKASAKGISELVVWLEDGTRATWTFVVN